MSSVTQACTDRYAVDPFLLQAAASISRRRHQHRLTAACTHKPYLGMWGSSASHGSPHIRTDTFGSMCCANPCDQVRACGLAQQWQKHRSMHWSAHPTPLHARSAHESPEKRLDHYARVNVEQMNIEQMHDYASRFATESSATCYCVV